MDIYLKERANGNAVFRFPSLPETVKVQNETAYQSYDILGKGKVEFPKGMNSGALTWNHVFFGNAAESGFFGAAWTAPTECIRILENWQKNGTVLNLMVTETAVNRDVTIAAFNWNPVGACGNYEYDIKFAEYTELKAYTTADLQITAFVKKVVARPEPPAGQQYTVVSGDNLWKIARKFYGGSGSDWEKIYNANVDVIESTANSRRGGRGSDHGHWIYPGEVLTIPA